jgi:hypothetical protein
MKTLLHAQWDRLSAVVLAAAGLFALGLGWIGVSGTDYVTEQLPYVVSGGLLGLFLVLAAASLWVSADLRDEWRKLDVLDQHVVALLEATALQPAPQPATRRKGASP